MNREVVVDTRTIVWITQKQNIGIDCIEISFNTDIYRQSRLPLIVNSSDSQACHDRIVLWITSLALQILGLSRDIAVYMTNTLQLVTYDNNTAFGVSIEEYFRTTPQLQGSWQGNRTWYYDHGRENIQRNTFSCTRPRQPQRKYLDWKVWKPTLETMINNISNRTLKYSLGSWCK